MSKPWLNASLSVNARVGLLLSAMTLEEKVAQLGYSTPCRDIDVSKHVHGIGGCLASNINDAIKLRKELIFSTRLGVPPSIFGETTHSGGAANTTVFPMPVSQGASFNVTLIEEIAAMNALQLRASGGDHALSPVLQVCTDPRFGRLEENFSEDPFLVGAYAIAATAGLQGRDGLGGVESYLGSPRTRVAAQAKHYAMYGAAGKDGYTPFGGGISARTLFDVYLRPWREFAQAGGRGVMASHNLVDWTPMHANKPLLADALRGRFGLGEGGYIGSDNTNVEGLSYYLHGFAANASDAARMAIAAGVDQDMPGAEYLQLAGLVRSGVVPLSHVDRAASNVLRKKFASRLFDLEPDPTLARERDSPEARDLARRAAEEGSVLLINRNGILPLGNASAPLRRVALVGPFALDGPITEQAMLGGYSPGVPPKGVVTIGQALKRRGIHVDAAAGCGAGVGGPHVAEEDFAKAVALAAAPDTDAVIVVLGTTSCGCCVKCGNGEAGDRMSLEPEGRQLELLAAVINATFAASAASSRSHARTPVVVVLIHGRPLSFEGGGATSAGGHSVLDGVDAMLAAWRPGEEGGTAVVNLLLGAANPSGKLAQAWQRSAGYIHSPTNPWFQVHSAMTAGRYFGNGDGTPLLPLFPFAHGLSYSVFSFASLSVALPAALPPHASGAALAKLAVNVTVTVRNNGTRAGATPVIVTYARLTHGVIRYAREVCGFSKVALAAGAEKRVSVRVRLSDLARWDPATDPPAPQDAAMGGMNDDHSASRADAAADQAPSDVMHLTANGLGQINAAPAARSIVSGAWVVDGGAYTFFAAGCVANPVLRDIHHHGDPSCPFYESAVVGQTAQIGREGELYGVYM
jgi:beta-glucosidase